MPSQRFPLALAAVVLSAASLAAQSSAPASLLPYPSRARVDAAVADAIDVSGVPSASVSIVQDGRVVYDHAYGYSQLDPNVQSAPQMRYSIGSVSKQFTALMLEQLQQEGKINLDDPVGKWLPELTRANEVTVREVLSHTAGYSDYWPEDYVMTPMMQPAKAQDILDHWAKKPLDFDPGTQWQYSNTDYVVAGRIAEMVAKQSIFEYLQHHVFAPLGMSGVLDQDARRLDKTDATGYYRHALGPLRTAPNEGFGWMFAAGELAMSAHDLSLWNIAVMTRDPRILSAKGWDDMLTEVRLKDGSGSRYALGFFTGSQNGMRVLEHSGEVSGFVSEQILMPDAKTSIVVLTNLDASGGASQIASGALRVLMDPTAPTHAAARARHRAGAAPEAKSDKGTEQARSIFEALQQGTIDRSLLTQWTSDYFTPEALDDFKTSLGPLGKPASFVQVSQSLRGGMTFHVYSAKFAGGQEVDVTTYVEPDGKLEQYLVMPAE